MGDFMNLDALGKKWQNHKGQDVYFQMVVEMNHFQMVIEIVGQSILSSNRLK